MATTGSCWPGSTKVNRSGSVAARAVAAALLLLAPAGTVSAVAARLDHGPERLRTAVSHLEQDSVSAAAQLEKLAREYPLLEDYVLYFAAVARRKLGEARPAIAHLEAVLKRHADSPIATPAAAELIDLQLASGERREALALAERYAAERQPAEAVVRIRMAAGQVLADRDPRRAAAFYASARRLAPDRASARLAGDALRRIRLLHPELAPRTPDELLEEAAGLAREARRDEQRRVIERFLETYPSHGRRHTAVMLRARSIAAEDGKAAAAEYLMGMVERTAGAQAKARLVFESAVYDWNANLNSQALEKFQTVVHMNTGIAEEQRAHYAIARIQESKRRYTAAARSYREAAKGKNARLGHDAEWRAGWVSYLAGNFDGAAFVFGRMAAHAGPPDRRPGKPKPSVPSGREEALYWQARALEHGTTPESARAIYEKLLEEFPDGFYAYLVERRTPLRARRPRPSAIPEAELPEDADLARALERAAALHRAALDGYVEQELRPALAKQRPERLRLLLPRLAAIGAYGVAMSKALGLYRSGDLSEEELYPYLYPHAFADIVARAASERGLSPFLVFALMRQESAFRTQAVSIARACGLMQLLPSTARHIAGEAGVEASDCDDLFDPEVNIKLGTTYLAKLARQFDGDPVLMLAGYNAGENAAARWQKRNAGMDEDEFIEHISYTETRGYVKKVLRNYRNYRRLYGQVAEDTEVPSGDGVGEPSR